jgi:arylsulfatase A-like enzyme
MSRPDSSHRLLALATVLGALFSPTATTQASAADRPNIIFITSDDHAAHAISAYGSKVNQTPQLDRLAHGGMIFRNAFVTNSICTPSRAATLTGKYSHLNGVPVFNRFDGSQQTFPKLLQQAGYYTAQIGKWHLGSDPTGFDHWEILPGQGAYNDPIFYTVQGERTFAGQYATDVITDLGIETIRNRPKSKPFFLMLQHKAPHRPWTPKEEHRKMFESRFIPEPDTLFDGYETRTDALHENAQTLAKDLSNRDLKLPLSPGLEGAERVAWLAATPSEVTVMVDGEMKTLKGAAFLRWKYQRYMKDYLACVQSIDDNIGRLLDFLKDSGLEKNTIVVYTGDQGFFLGDHGMFDKRFMYEEALRTPLLVRWPAGIKPGSTTNAMALNVDFAPTFLEAAGARVPEDVQGRSLLNVLRGKPPSGWRTSMYYRYYHDPGDHNTRSHLGVRTMTHKLIHFWKTDHWEMFDLQNDPREMLNLYGQPGQEKRTAELKAELQRLKRELKDDDRFANEALPNGVDGTAAKLRGK